MGLTTATAKPGAMSKKDIPGGDHTAVQATDGTWTIKDVPIFGTLPAGVRNNPDNVDRESLLLFVATHQTKFKKGKFLAPLHFNHHHMDKTTPAGFFLPTRVDKANLGGKQVDSIFADLIGISDEDYQKIKALEFPYRSVEVRSWTGHAFASLALLDTQDPFFEYEMMTVGEEFKGVDATPFGVEDYAHAVAYRGKEDGALVLFNFAGGSPMPEDDDKKKDGKKMAGDTKPPMEGEDQKKPQFTGDQREKIKGLLTQLMAAFEGDDEDKEEENDKEMGEDTGKEEKTPVEQKKDEAMSAKTAAEMGSMAGRISAMEKKQAKREKADAEATRAAAAFETLKAWHLSGETKERIIALAAQGETALTAFVEAFTASVPKEPAENFETFQDGHNSGDPKPVAAFAAKGPEALENARKLAQQHKELGSRTKLSLERFIEVSMDGTTN